MNARLPDLDWVDDRLNAWARYFKDRHRFESCKSIENRFRATSDVCAAEGWGQPSPTQVPPVLDLRSVLQTHEALQMLVRSQRWALTYGYCYPSLERWRVLKLMKKFTGQRFTWKGYLDEIAMGRMRIAAYLLM